MPKHSALNSSRSVPTDASIDDLCQQFWSDHANVELASTNAEKRRQKKFRAQARDELQRRLGDQIDAVLESFAEGYLCDDAERSPPFGVNCPPQRVRRPRVMYVEQKTDGNQSLQDRGAAVVGEVSFSKSGRTAYFNGKTFQRIRGVYANYQCLEDGNEYWISGVKKRGTNRHWAGGGSILVTKPDR